MGQVKGIAKQIHDRWCRLLYDIKTGYDDEGNFDRQYKNLRYKLSGKRPRSDSAEDGASDEDEVGEEPVTKQQSQVTKDEHEIKRGRVGIIMPHRNAFDFTERPAPKGDQLGGTRNKSEGRLKLRKVMESLKRSNRQTF